MKEDRIGVFVRVRPYQDKQPPSTFILSLNQKQISVKDKERDKQQDLNFSFDHIFPVKSSQKDVFDRIGQPIVDAAFQGINGTIFAYGQTSSGKTYTCIGPDCENQEDKGLLPRSVGSIFNRIGQSPNFIEFRIKISMVEIYMEKIRDLLDPSKIDLKLRQNKAKGLYIQDVTQQYVSSTEQALKVFKKGVANRVVAFTNMNDVSSRSHMAFILTLHQNNLRDGSAKSGKITVVDLAGSEKVSKTHAQGKVLDQAKQINKSLSSLGNVINALTDSKLNHIPYRDSKLTRLLQQSLGGNSKTSLIINISPSSYNASQSISSLRFGYRAKEIKNKPKINKQYTISQLLLLLEKAQKRNQQLQLLVQELTAKKAKSKKSGFIQNLIDSDNPIMSALSDNQQEQKFKTNKSALKTIKKCYESEIGSQGQEDQNKKLEQQKQKTQQFNVMNQRLNQRQEEMQIISEELVRVNNQRIAMSRELDICQERLQLVMKEAKLNLMKLNTEKRQGQHLLQKYIKENLENQEKEAHIEKMKSKIMDFEEKFVKLSQIHEGLAKKSSLFGLQKNYNEQSSKIISQALNEKEQNQQFRQQCQLNIDKEKKILQLESSIKKLNQQISLYQHLEKVKQQLIKEKLKFMGERDRVYKDLQNRIQKVLQLEESLDQQKERRNNLEKIISMDQSEKGRKILSLQTHLSQTSENYYVLKGQQSSWIKNNKKTEDKINQQTRAIILLQGENIELRAQIQCLRMKCEQFEIMNENSSVMDIELQDEQSQWGNGNIVKIVRSNLIK